MKKMLAMFAIAAAAVACSQEATEEATVEATAEVVDSSATAETEEALEVVAAEGEEASAE